MAVPVGRNAAAPAGGTQSFVRTLSECWGRPSLVALEILWRWVYGIPALWLMGTQVRGVLARVTEGTFDPGRLGLDKALLADPVGVLSAEPMVTIGKVSRALAAVAPGLRHGAVWLLPVLLVAWVVVSSVGRTAMLRRRDPALRARVGTLVGLQAIRMAVLVAVFAAWFAGLVWSSRVTIGGAMASGAEPNVVGFCALVIVLTLVMFVGWGTVSWWFGMAPLLAMGEGTGVLASLRAAGRVGKLRGKLVEVNMVMGIVKIALLVLAMVFSATPLPFESVTSATFLAWWWAGVITVYLVASDFFHVARLVAYLGLWRGGLLAGKL